MYLRINAGILLATIVFLSTGCAPAMKELRLNQAQLTTMSAVCTAASDSVSTPGHVATQKSACESEFRLKYEQIRGNTQVGAENAKAQAAAFLVYAQRMGYMNGVGGYGYGYGASQNTGYLGRCGPAGC